jgi:hypothetical protein
MMMRWLDVLLSYDFSVVYLKGMDNVLPDALSRLYPLRENNKEEHVSESKRQRLLSSLKSNHAISEKINKRKLDRSINSISTSSVNPVNTTVSVNARKSIVDIPATENNDCKLFYIQSGQTIHADYLIAPKSERKGLLEDAHNKVGHNGAEQMVKRLHYHHEGNHWPNLINDCIEYIRKCTECQKHNIQKRGFGFHLR